jgi:coronin-1B/1C/6
VKIWSIPDGGLTETLREPIQTLTGHGKPVTLLAWSPTASNVLASVGKEPSVRIWDVQRGESKIAIGGFEGLVQDIAWSPDGSRLITADKAKSAKIHDPRSASIVAEWKPHGGSKPFKALFLGASNYVLTIGFTSSAKREFKIWDVSASLEKPTTALELDASAGTIMPFYDEDTRMLYLTGKVRRGGGGGCGGAGG